MCAKVGLEVPLGCERVLEAGTVREQKVAPVGAVVPRQSRHRLGLPAVDPFAEVDEEVRPAHRAVRVPTDHCRAHRTPRCSVRLDQRLRPAGLGKRVRLAEDDDRSSCRAHPGRACAVEFRENLLAHRKDVDRRKLLPRLARDGERCFRVSHDDELQPVGNRLAAQAPYGFPNRVERVRRQDNRQGRKAHVVPTRSGASAGPCHPATWRARWISFEYSRCWLRSLAPRA